MHCHITSSHRRNLKTRTPFCTHFCVISIRALAQTHARAPPPLFTFASTHTPVNWHTTDRHHLFAPKIQGFEEIDGERVADAVPQLSSACPKPFFDAPQIHEIIKLEDGRQMLGRAVETRRSSSLSVLINGRRRAQWGERGLGRVSSRALCFLSRRRLVGPPSRDAAAIDGVVHLRGGDATVWGA